MPLDEGLRAWVRDHRVCWEMAPLDEMSGLGRLQVGYELSLFARGVPGERLEAAAAADLYEKLSALALAAVPLDCATSRCDVEPFDASLHLRPETRWEPEVQATLRIAHGNGYLQAIDDCERRCAKEAAQNLRAIGACERIWSAGP